VTSGLTMRRLRRRSSQQRGFTLIELMVSLVVFASVTAGLMSVAITMVGGYREQEATISTEGAARATIDFLAQAVRGASPGVPTMNIRQNHNCALGAFAVTNNAVVPGLPNTSDELTVVMPHGSVTTSSTAAFDSAITGSFTVLSTTGLAAGDYVLITDFSSGHLVKINTVVGLTLNVVAAGGCAGPVVYAVGSVVIRALRARFHVAIPPGETVPMLMLDPDGDPLTNNSEPIAEGIENMEIVLGIDANGDGMVTKVGVPTVVEDASVAGADEWHLNRAGEAVPLMTSLRAVRITLVARTGVTASGVNAFRLPAIEDRVANIATDSFRRRILTSTIEVRNLGGSP
jgi:prepilin-type N-terminal cleavage/methylation domain-containing protein